MNSELDHTTDMILLEQIEQNPNTTQASLAESLGVAVGTINWHLKRLITKGYVKVKRATRRKLLYIITPEGISLRARLTLDYINTSFVMYRETRKRVIELLGEVHRSGSTSVRLFGEGDIADVCRLTCLEQGMPVDNDPGAPALEVHGMHVVLRMDGKHD